MRSLNSKLGFVEQIILKCFRKDGSLKWIIDTDLDPMLCNSMANTGMVEVGSLIVADVGGTAFDVIGIGETNTAENAAHTALQGPIKRKVSVGTQVTTTFANDTCQWVATFSAALDTLSGTDSICEAGVFNNTVAGDMLFRKIFTAKSINWDDADTLEVTAKCVMKQGA